MASGPVVTPAAQRFMRRMVRMGGGAGGFRLAVARGGCSGFDTHFTIEAAPAAGETVLALDGCTLYLPADTAALLEGVVVDFADAPASTGLSFHDPNAAACGCSTSATAGSPAVTRIDVAAIGRAPRHA